MWLNPGDFLRLQTYRLIRSARATGWRCGGYFLVGSFIIRTFQCDFAKCLWVEIYNICFFWLRPRRQSQCLLDSFGWGPQSSIYIVYIYTHIFYTHAHTHTYIYIYSHSHIHTLWYTYDRCLIYTGTFCFGTNYKLWQWGDFYALVNVHVLNNAVVPWNMLRWYEKLQFNVMTVGSNMGISSLCCKCFCQHHSIICTPDK